MRRQKVATVVLLVVFSVMVSATHAMGQLFPVYPAAFAVSMGVVLAAAYGRDDRLWWGLALTCLTASAYLVWMGQFGASMIGTDPDSIARWAQSVIDTGGRDAIGSAFYRAAPLMMLLTGIGSIIVETTARWGTLIYALVAGIVSPLLIAAIANRLWASRDATLVAAVLGATMTPFVSYAVGPIPQNIAVVAWTGFVLSAVLFLRGAVSKPAGLGLLVLFATVSVYSHKISVFLLFVTLAVFVAVLVALSALGPTSTSTGLATESFVTLSMLVAVLLHFQWEFVANYTHRAIGRIMMIGASPSGVPDVEYVAAVPLNQDLLSILGYTAHIVVALFIAGLCWLFLAYRGWDDEATVFALVATAIITALQISTVFVPLSLNRILFYAAPLLAVVIAGGIVSTRPRKAIGVVLAILIVSQLFVAPATPDYPDTTRSYLTASEVDAKLWGQAHLDNVSTDHAYAGETPPPNIDAAERSDVYRPLGDDVLQGQVSDEYACVAHREGSDNIHQVERGTYRWTWDMAQHLASTRHQLHSTGDVRHYCLDAEPEVRHL